MEGLVVQVVVHNLRKIQNGRSNMEDDHCYDIINARRQPININNEQFITYSRIFERLITMFIKNRKFGLTLQYYDEMMPCLKWFLSNSRTDIFEFYWKFGIVDSKCGLFISYCIFPKHLLAKFLSKSSRR